MEPMNSEWLAVRSVQWKDMWTLTRMAYTNMTGVDQQFTRMAQHPVWRLAGYVALPFYFWTAGRGYKALADGQIVGCAFVHFLTDSAVVFNVNVNRAYRRRGVARALLAHLETVARQRGVGWLALQVDRDNVPAGTLYEGLGFRQIHPDFWRGPWRTVPVTPGLAVEPLRQRLGQRLYRHYARLELEYGESWGAGVLKREFVSVPAGGQFWRCLVGQQEVGCAWLEDGDGQQRPLVFLLLQPQAWAQEMVTLGLVQLLFEHQAGGVPAGLDLFCGSSGHHAALAPMLQERGFVATRQPRILMLKKLLSNSATQ